MCSRTHHESLAEMSVRLNRQLHLKIKKVPCQIQYKYEGHQDFVQKSSLRDPIHSNKYSSFKIEAVFKK